MAGGTCFHPLGNLLFILAHYCIRMKRKSFTKHELPKEGAKIEYWTSPTRSEVDVWRDGSLVLRPYMWDKVQVWYYIDENYVKERNEQ